MFKLTVTSLAGEVIGSGESLEGESASDAFVRLFGGMLGIDGAGEWTQEGGPGRYAVVTHFASNSGHSPGASNIFFLDTEPPQALNSMGPQS